MPGLFGVLDVAGRGLLAAQRGVHVTGHNIANANTPGYSAQRQILGNAFPIVHSAGLLGTGVEQITVERLHDAFVQTQLLRQGGSFGSTRAQAEALSQIEEVLNEQDADGVATVISRLYDSFSDLASAAAPGASVEREALRGSAQSLIDTFHAFDGQLRELQGSADRAIRDVVPEVNEFLVRIQELNEEIVRQETVAPANDMRDLRDQAVRDLALLVDVSTYETGDGALVVTLSSGLPLVEGGSARTLVAQADPTHPFDPTYVQVRYQDGANDLDVTADLGGGRLGGLLRARDTHYASAIRSLDTIAYNLAASVNSVHQLGTGLDGSVGDFFAAPAAVADAARGLALDASVLATPDAIAAGLGGGPSDNRNALALADLRHAATTLFLPGDPPGPASGPSRTLLQHVGAVVGDIGQQARSLNLAQGQQARVLEGLENRRDQVAGVSIDEEVTRLIRLQAAFQANSRVVVVVDELLDDVLRMI